MTVSLHLITIYISRVTSTEMHIFLLKKKKRTAKDSFFMHQALRNGALTTILERNKGLH